MLSARPLALLLVAALALPLPGLAERIRVPGDAASIQQAIDAANPGDEIQIGGGTYAENLSITTDGLTLKGSKKAVIDGSGGIPISVTGASGVTLTGMTLRNAGTAAIFARGASDLLITKVTITGASLDGIRIEGPATSPRVEKNRISNVGADCISLAGLPPPSGGSVLGNRLRVCGRNGVDVLGADHQIVKNSIYAPGNNGVTLRGTNGLAIGNSIVSSDNDGMTVDSFASGNTLEKNKVNLSSDDGVDISGSGNRFVGNKVNNSGQDAFEVLGGNNVFEKNQVNGAGDDCFDIESAGNLVTENCDDGYEIDGSGNTFRRNKTSGAIDNCYEVNSDGNDFEGEKASKCGDGFEVLGTGNTFTANKATGNRDDDLRDFNLDDGTNTYTGNKFGNATFGPAPAP